MQRLAKSLRKRWSVLAKTGQLRLKKRKALKQRLEVVEGMNFDRGYLSAYFMTNPETQEAIFEEPMS